jgi:hypothetical protein
VIDTSSSTVYVPSFPLYVTTGGVASCLIVSETAPDVRIGVVVVVTEHDRVITPSAVIGPSSQPSFVTPGVPKPCQVTETLPVYQPFLPSGAAGETCAQTNPVPLSPGPLIFGLFVVFAPPVGKAVSNHCGKNWSSRWLHDALGTGSCPRNTSSSCCSVIEPPP